VKPWLKVSTSINLLCLGTGHFVDWLFGYDGQNTLFLFPLLFASLVLTPLNLVAVFVWLFKAKKDLVGENTFWFVIAVLTPAAFFIPRLPR
jgi:hypothetical protein